MPIAAAAVFIMVVAPCTGCRKASLLPVAPPVLGEGVDQIMQIQAENAEPAKHVIYAHEFELNSEAPDGKNSGIRLNEYGQDHVRRIASNLRSADHFPVVVQRSETSTKHGTQSGYPVHFNERLDLQRRRVVVLALTALGVEQADDLVTIAPAFAEGYMSTEASWGYNNAFSGDTERNRSGR